MIAKILEKMERDYLREGRGGGCTFHRINYKDVSKPEKVLEIGTRRIRAKNEAYSLTEK